MNTKIHYLYRDGSNHKQGETVVVEGEVTFDDFQPHLDEGQYFIPGQLGLPMPQAKFASAGYAFPTEDDHPFCEIDSDDFELTDDEPTVEVTAAELIEAITDIEWDEAHPLMP